VPDKLHQEIDELLASLDTFPKKKAAWRRAVSATGAFFLDVGDMVSSIPLPRLSAGHILLIAILVIVLFYLAGPDGGITRWVIAGAILVFIAAFAWSLRRNSPGGRSQRKYWRDKPIDLRPGQDGGLRSWWNRRGRR